MSACEKMWSFVRCTMLLFAVKFWSRPPELEQNNWKISFKQLYFSECFSPPWRKQQCFGEKETFLFKIHFDFVFLYTCAAVLCYDFLTKAINWLWDGHSFIFSQTNVPLFLVLRSTLTKGHIKIIVLWEKTLWFGCRHQDQIISCYPYRYPIVIDTVLHIVSIILYINYDKRRLLHSVFYQACLLTFWVVLWSWLVCVCFSLPSHACYIILPWSSSAVKCAVSKNSTTLQRTCLGRALLSCLESCFPPLWLCHREMRAGPREMERIEKELGWSTELFLEALSSWKGICGGRGCRSQS